MTTFNFKKLTVNVPEAEILQAGDSSQLIINKNDVDFDKFKEEILEKMDKGNKEILDVLMNFKDQYHRNTKRETGYQDEVLKALIYIIKEVEKISRWHKSLVSQGVAISYQIQGVFQSVQENDRLLTYKLSSVNDKNGHLRSELNSERSCIRILKDEVSVAQEETRKLQNELHYFTENNQTLQQQIRDMNMSRGAIDLCFDISTLNSDMYASEDNLILRNNLSDLTPVRNRNTVSKYSGVFGNKPVKPNQDIYFDVDVNYKIKERLIPSDMIFEVAVTNKITLSSDRMDVKGWSFGARTCDAVTGVRGFFSSIMGYDSDHPSNGGNPIVCLTVWRRDRRQSHSRIGNTEIGDTFSDSFRVKVERSRNRLTIINNTNKSIYCIFTDLDEYGDLWPSFGIFNYSKVDVTLTLKPLLSYVD